MCYLKAKLEPIGGISDMAFMNNIEKAKCFQMRMALL